MMLPSEELWNIFEKIENAKTPEETAYWEKNPMSI